MVWFPRSLAGQVFALQTVVVVIVVLAGSALALLDARRDSDEAAREEVTGIAIALADSPSTAAAIKSGSATEILQPVTEAVRKSTSMADPDDCACVAFITIMAPDRTRFTHTNPDLIGGQYQGTIEPALRGEVFTEVYDSPLGASIRTIAPVRDAGGAVVGLVAVGITLESMASRWQSQLPAVASISIGALALSLVGIWAIRRRLLRQTRGLAPSELRVMYDHHDAILQSISEGLIVVEPDGVAVINDEARRLLKLRDGEINREDLPEFLQKPDTQVRDEVRVTEDRVLVVNRSSVTGGIPGAEVVTIRDRTELQGALGELSSLKTFTDSLRAQAHESANKLHAVITMVEMGRPGEAVKFATKELATSQHLVDRLEDAVHEPAVTALLLAKTAEADERGISLTITEETRFPAASAGARLSAQDMVTILGNLIDNAFDACDRQDPWVEVTVMALNSDLVIQVADSGAGMDSEAFARAMQRGYSTKTGSGHHGLGLALVAQIVKRHQGTLRADLTYGSVITVSFNGAATAESHDD